MNTIEIDRQLCTRCSRCAKVCPAEIFSGKDIDVQNVERCIGCGHCTSVCAAAAVRHSLFPPAKVHAVDYTKVANSEQLMELIRARRSMRNFSKRAIPQEFLDKIVEAAHLAPTATNAQKVAFTLITDPELLQSVSQFTLDTFGSIVRMVDNPLVRPIVKRLLPTEYRYVPMFKAMEAEFAAGNDQILRGATALLLIHTPAWVRFGVQDSNLAYQNGSLIAQALGVGQFYTGFVLTATAQKKGKLERLLGIDGKIHAGMALGMAAFEYPNYTDRNDVTISYLRNVK